jgi:membrane-bound lytic murein transglycosylase F
MRPIPLLALLALLPAAAAADLPEIQTAGRLRVLVVDGSPAFYSLRPGAEPGMDREILEGFARLHRLTLSSVTAPAWDALVPWLVEGKGDLAAGGVTATPARAQHVAFSAEVFPTRLVVVTRRPRPPVRSIDELREEKLGTIRGSSMAEAIAALGLPPRNLDDSFPSGGLPEGLRSGRVTAIVSGVEDALLYKLADPALELGVFIGRPASLAYGIRKDEPKLKAALDEYIGNLRRTPTWNRLLLKYFGDSAPELLRRARE